LKKNRFEKNESISINFVLKKMEFIRLNWKKYLLIVLGISILLFTLPINLFPGVIEQKFGLTTTHDELNLSLSYFIGMGYNIDDLEFVTDFYLTAKGIVLAIIVIFGLPGLVLYKLHADKQKKIQFPKK
jgi:hypothetical protein